MTTVPFLVIQEIRVELLWLGLLPVAGIRLTCANRGEAIAFVPFRDNGIGHPNEVQKKIAIGWRVELRLLCHRENVNRTKYHTGREPRADKGETMGTEPAAALEPAGVATITAAEEDWWLCHCGNTPHRGGFAPIDRNGNEVEPTAAEWPEPLYACNDCGLVMDADTLDTEAHTVAVVGRIPLVVADEKP